MRHDIRTLCLLALTMAAGLSTASGGDDPRIKGRPLSRWLKQIQSRNRGLQMRASRALREAKEEQIPKIIPRLLPLLGADRRNTRFPVAQVLGEYGPAAHVAVPHLLPMLEGTQHERNRAAAAEALGRILKDTDPSEEVEKVSQALVAVFGDKYEDVRREAAVAIGRIGPAAKPAVQPLQKLLGDREFAVRAAAAWACGRMREHAKVHIDKLIAMLHGERDIATTVVYAIGEIGPVHENVIPNVIDRLEKVFYARWGGFKVGPRSYCVGTISEGTVEEYARFCFDVLARFGDKSAAAVPLMERVLSEGHWNRRGRMHRAIGAMKVLRAVGPKAKSAVPEIRQALKVERWDRRIPKEVVERFKKEAAGALEAITGEKP
ncbi:MAG: HEAT repeat domain-containing protein [Planctomycetota bacterium]